jgi:all-trans-retinol 13,14-reductase
VRGVRLVQGEEIRAPAVIGAAGALNTLRLLPAEERRREWVASIEALPPSCAHVCLNVGFRGDIRAAGASESNRWLVQDWEVDVEPWDLGGGSPSMYVSFPSLKDGLPRPRDGLHTAELVVLTSWEPFARFAGTRWQRRGEEYEKLKQAVSERMLSLLFKRMPALEPLLAYHELSTPLSSAHFVRAVHGASYGLEAIPARFANPWLRPRTPVRGLYLAGCDVAIVGVVGALAGGVLATLAIEPERASTWLREAVRTYLRLPTGRAVRTARPSFVSSVR